MKNTLLKIFLIRLKNETGVNYGIIKFLDAPRKDDAAFSLTAFL